MSRAIKVGDHSRVHYELRTSLGARAMTFDSLELAAKRLEQRPVPGWKIIRVETIEVERDVTPETIA